MLSQFATCGPFRELAGTLYREAFWLVSDHLGTPRMIVNKSGTLASVKRHDYLPFGEELPAGTGGRTWGQGYSGDSVRQHFTGYEADGETGLNFAEARYQSNLQGRFTSVDPFGASASIASPQSFNRYSYVQNNPVNAVDPSGMAMADIIAAEDQNDKLVGEARALKAFNDVFKAGNTAQMRSIIAANPSIGYEMNSSYNPNAEGNQSQNASVVFDKVELLDSAGAGYPKGPLGTWPENPVAEATKVENALAPNTYNLDLDAEKVDVYSILAIRVTFHAQPGFKTDPSLISVSPSKEGRQRYDLLEEYLPGTGRDATQRDYGQVIFRVRSTRQDGSRVSPDITVTVGALKEGKWTDLNNRNFKAKNYETLYLHLRRIN